jgi:hypothetical protein
MLNLGLSGTGVSLAAPSTENSVTASNKEKRASASYSIPVVFPKSQGKKDVELPGASKEVPKSEEFAHELASVSELSQETLLSKEHSDMFPLTLGEFLACQLNGLHHMTKTLTRH